MIAYLNLIIGTFDPAWIIAAAGLTAGIITAIVAFRKAGPESSQLLVDAAKDVVVIQRGLVEDLKNEMTEMKDRITELEIKRAEVERESTKIKLENEELKERVKTLEHELVVIKNGNGNGYR